MDAAFNTVWLIWNGEGNYYCGIEDVASAEIKLTTKKNATSVQMEGFTNAQIR